MKNKKRLRLNFPVSALLGLTTLMLPIPGFAIGEFAGIYFGTFTGTGSGHFATLVRADNTAVVSFYDQIIEQGVVINTLPINNDGTFTLLTGTDTIEGAFTQTGVSGTTSGPGTSVSFSGTKATATGPLENAGGYFSGTKLQGSVECNGVSQGTPSGTIDLIVAADGTAYMFGITFLDGSLLGMEGGFFNVSGNGVISGTLLDGTQITGNVSLGVPGATGDLFFTDGICTAQGNWNAPRVDALPVPPQVATNMEDVVIDFGVLGLWARMNDSSWLKLHNNSPDLIATVDVDNNGQEDVVAAFSGTGGGLFVKRNLGAWSKMHNLVPQAISAGDLDNNGQDDVVIDFGAIGLWARMNDSNWLKLNNNSPDQILVANMDGIAGDDVIGVFGGAGGGIFVKRNLGAWSKLHNAIPDDMIDASLDSGNQTDLVIDFGILGLWARMNDSSWLKLHNNSPDLLSNPDVDGNDSDDVIASFGSTFGGLWQKVNLGGWSKINNNAPDLLTEGDVDDSGADDLIADFTSTIGGIFVKRNAGPWLKLHNGSAEAMAVGNLDSN